MKYSINWLSKYVYINDLDLKELINKIAYQIVDVEEVFYENEDVIIDVDSKIITNRAYCFGHRGLAREISVLLGRNWEGDIENIKVKLPNKKNQSKLNLKLTINDKALCPRFTAVVIKGIKIQESPAWLKNALKSIGQKSINNIVDITNYVMFDLGQPVHAYDYKKIKGEEIIVRRAFKNECIKTLDDIERKLNEDILVIADSQKPLAIAGVMGGKLSSITSKTTDIVLEVASFHPVNIRKTSKKLKLRTDAVTRFEKGPDITNIPNVMNYLINLVLENCGGEVSSEIIDLYYPEKSILRTNDLILEFDTSRIKKLLGFEVDKNFVLNLFKGFGIKVIKYEDKVYKLSIPPYRNDIKEPADLIEDIGRMFGYQNIPNVLPVNYICPPSKNKKLEVYKKSRLALTGSGLDEVITYPFISEKESKLIDYESIPILNPQSLDYAYLRPSLIVSLAKVVGLNSKNFNEFGIFEIAREFHKNNEKAKDYLEDRGESKRPIEKEVISGCYYIKENYNLAIAKLKGAIENLLDELHIKNYKIESNGDIQVNDEVVGNITIVPDNIKDFFDIPQYFSYFNINLAKLVENYNETILYKDFIRYQGSKLDYSILIPENLTIANLIEKIPKHEWISDLKVLEVYRDKKLNNKKSVLLSFSIQNPNGNITSSEIYDLGILIENELKTIKGLEIRGEGLKKPTGYKPSIIQTGGKKFPNGIVVGKIIKVEKHPNADNLSVCKVQIGKNPNSDVLQIITGAKNIKIEESEGLFVPVALVGSYVYSLKDKTPTKIKKAKIRGIESEGMLCSSSELGLDDNNEGIMILTNKVDNDIGSILY